MAGGVFKRFLELVLDTDSAKKLERDTQRALKKGTDPKEPVRQLGTIERGMNKLKIAAVGVGVAIAGGLALGLRKMVRESAEAQAGTAQLEAAIKSTGGAAGRSVKQLTDMASALQKTTIFSDDAVKGAEGLLLTFTKIAGPTFDRATGAVLDMATAMAHGTGDAPDLKAASVQVGKALQDPIKGVTALTKVGVTFSAEQKKVIQGLAETGRVAEAQALILTELETEFGGSAKAARDTLGGALTALGETWNDLFVVSRESSTGIIRAINAISDALPKLRDRLDTAASAFQRFWDGGRRIREGNMRRLGRGDAADALLLEILAGETDIGVAGPPRRTGGGGGGSPADTAAGRARASELEAAFLLAGQRAIVLAQTLNQAIYGIQSDPRLGSPGQMATEAMRQQMEAGLSGFKIPTTLAPLAAPGLGGGDAGVGGFAASFKENLTEITSAAQVAALGIQQSFQDAFLALGDEGNAFANFFGTLFEGMAAGVLSSIAQIAAGKVAENAAYAIEALAKGLLFGDPKALASAAVFGKAALAWAAAGGLAGAAASAIGGGGSSSFRGSDAVGRRIDQLDRKQPDVIVYVDGIDPKNPRHQAKVGQANVQYQQRTGAPRRDR